MVLVARRPKSGREEEFSRWLLRLNARARMAPGYGESSLHPPNAAHPGEWVIVYRFETTAELQAWLDSPERAALLAEGRDLFVGDAREQVVAHASDEDVVTAVASFRIRPGQELAFEEAQGEVEQAVADFPGFVKVQRYDPIPDVQDETVVTVSFDTRAHLDAWLNADVRRRLLTAVDKHVESGRTLNVVGGFGGWFQKPDGRIPKWKQATVVLTGILPLSLALNALRIRFAPDLPWPVAGVTQNFISVTTLTWVVMPRLTKLFAPWLER